MRKTRKAYAWCLTINNPRYIPDFKLMEDICKDPEQYSIAYMYAGRENFGMIAQKYQKKTRHLQMVVVFGYLVNFYDVKKLFVRAHIEPMSSTLTNAVAYCKKEDYKGYEAGNYDFARWLVERNSEGENDPSCVSAVSITKDTHVDPPSLSPGSVQIDGTDFDPSQYTYKELEDMDMGRISYDEMSKLCPSGGSQYDPRYVPEKDDFEINFGYDSDDV